MPWRGFEEGTPFVVQNWFSPTHHISKESMRRGPIPRPPPPPPEAVPPHQT